MEIGNGIFTLSPMRSANPGHRYLGYTDTKGNKVMIDHELLVRLYELLKHDKERAGIIWEDYTNGLFLE